jgi:transcriptional regulator with XRE-family HTH domain
METSLYTAAIMPQKKAPQSVPGAELELPRERLSRLRKERGWTQVELAERVGISQTLISDYERGRLRLNADIVVRLANALEVTANELLQPGGPRHSLRRKPSLRVLRRLEKIEKLPAHQQSTLLKTIDTFLRGATASR